jgi:prepilin-type N-terminal cleavage/methylation domain-containing protein
VKPRFDSFLFKLDIIPVVTYLPNRAPLVRGGFTLIESALVTAIVGVGVTAMLQLLAAGSVSNASGAQLTTGLNIARNIRELTLGLSFADPTTPTNWGAESGENLATYDDLDDFDDRSFAPPIDARRQSLSDYAGWQQSIAVQSVDPDRLTLNVTKGSTPASRVTVTVTHHGKFICDLSWVVLDASTN